MSELQNELLASSVDPERMEDTGYVGDPNATISEDGEFGADLNWEDSFSVAQKHLGVTEEQWKAFIDGVNEVKAEMRAWVENGGNSARVMQNRSQPDEIFNRWVAREMRNDPTLSLDEAQALVKQSDQYAELYGNIETYETVLDEKLNALYSSVGLDPSGSITGGTGKSYGGGYSVGFDFLTGDVTHNAPSATGTLIQIGVGAAFGAGLASGVAGALGFTSGFGAGAVKGTISSIAGQAITTGKIDPASVFQSALIGAVGGMFDELTTGELSIGTDAAGNPVYMINGEVMNSATNFVDNQVFRMAELLGIDYAQAAGIVEGIITGVISGEDLEGIALNAVGGWGSAKTEQWLRDVLGETGLDVDNWFRDGTTNISTDSLVGLADAGLQALIDGGMSKGDALKTIYDFFNDGGSLDFVLPGLLEFGGADVFDFSLCGGDNPPWFCGIDLPDVCSKNEDGEKPWYCEGVDVNLPPLPCGEGLEWDEALRECVPIPNPCGEGLIWDADLGDCVPDIDITCPEGFQNEDGECVPIDISITCPDGFRDENGVCVPIGNPCGEGYIWDIELGECVPDVSITCPDGFKDENGVCVPIGNPCGDGYIWDADLGECVPDVNIPCPEGWDRDEDGICIEPPVVCGEGYSWDQDLGECVPDFDDLCPPGFERDDLTGKCMEIECPEGWDKDEDGICIEPRQPCSDGYSWDPNLGECVENKREPCPEGQERNALGQCVEPTKKCAEGQRLIDGECVDINTPNIELPTITPPEGGDGMFNTRWSALEWQNTAPKPYRPATLTPYERLRNSLISSKKPNGGMFS